MEELIEYLSAAALLAAVMATLATGCLVSYSTNYQGTRHQIRMEAEGGGQEVVVSRR